MISFLSIRHLGMLFQPGQPLSAMQGRSPLQPVNRYLQLPGCLTARRRAASLLLTFSSHKQQNGSNSGPKNSGGGHPCRRTSFAQCLEPVVRHCSATSLHLSPDTVFYCMQQTGRPPTHREQLTFYASCRPSARPERKCLGAHQQLKRKRQ